MIITIARHTVRVSVLVLGIILILLALLTVSARLGLPLIASYKSEIESRVSDYLRNPVDIGQLTLKWEGFGPMLMASDVAVFESEDRKVTLEQLLIDVNLAKSLLRGIPVINELSLVGANLAIDVDQDGQLLVHGMEAARKRPGNVTKEPVSAKGPGVDVVAWLFNARKVGLLDSTVTLIDPQSDQTLVIEDLSIRAENTGNLHQLRIELTLPQALGGQLEAGIDLTGNSRNLSASNGNIYVFGENLQVQALSKLGHLSSLRELISSKLDFLDTDVSIELWGKWRDGKLVSARGPIRTSAIVDTRTDTKLLDTLSSTIEYARKQDSFKFDIKNTVASLAGETFKVDQMTANWSESDGQPWSLSGSGEEFPLPTGLRLPVALISHQQPELAETIKQAAPVGSLTDWSINIRQTDKQPVIDLSMNVESLTLQATDKLPGFGPVDGKINLVESMGSVELDAQQMSVTWRLLNDQPVIMDSIIAAFDIDLSDTQRLVASGELMLLDDGIEFDSRIKATVHSDQSPHLDIQSRYSAKDIVALKQWLPRSILPANAVNWIDRAIHSGTARDGSLLFFGSVDDFPFDEGEGVFRSSVDVDNGQLAFLPTWPAVKNLNGTFDINGLTVSGSARSSKINSFDITQTTVLIPNVLVPILSVKGTGSGDLQQMIDFANQGPLREFLEPAMSDMSGTGNAQMDIEVLVPLYGKPKVVDETVSASVQDKDNVYLRNWVPRRVSGSVFLAGNSVGFGRANMVLGNSTGAVAFDLNGIRINALKAYVLGHRVLVDARTAGSGRAATTHIAVNGAFEATDLLAHYGNPLDQFMRGASQWDMRLAIPHSAKRIAQSGVSLRVTSDLVGTELQLPAPYYKSTATATSFELETAFRDPIENQYWDIRYGESFRAWATLSDSGLDSLLIQLGSDEIAETLRDNPAPGIRLQGMVPSLAADGWVETISRYIDSFPANSDEPEPILPISIQLDIDSLILGSQSLGAARLRSNSDETFLNTVITNKYLSGNLRYPRRYWEKDTALTARISHADWEIIDALNSESAGPSQNADRGELDPRLLPPIEARIAKLTHGPVTLRDIVLRAQPDVSGLAISTLGFAYDTMRLVGQGYWHLRDPQGVNVKLTDKHATKLDLVLQSDDFGAGLNELGLDDIILDGEGSVDMQLTWPGPAYKPSIEQLDGSVKLTMERGSIIPLEPGAGRVVGLFALQALPRRLNLDFKDVTADGLAFRRITGDVTINKGVADVKLVQLTGPIGVVDITGSSDLELQEFDHQITVLPRVSAALPIIGAITGGASAGIGALVAAGFLKALGIDFDRIGLRNYSLKGPWEKPFFQPLSSGDLQKN